MTTGSIETMAYRGSTKFGRPEWEKDRYVVRAVGSYTRYFAYGFPQQGNGSVVWLSDLIAIHGHSGWEVRS